FTSESSVSLHRLDYKVPLHLRCHPSRFIHFPMDELKPDDKKIKMQKLDAGLSQPPPPPRKNLNLEENLHKTQLIPAGAAFGNKGKGAGYYCQHCDLNFRDSLSWLDHLNSKQHLRASNQSGRIVRATLIDVQRKLNSLRESKHQQEQLDSNVDFWKRIEERKGLIALEKKMNKERRQLRKAKRKEEIQTTTLQEGNQDVGRLMGFTGFGSSKV
ncbi:U4/U6.U5 small nuclear ribonucleoprotein component snu23, partial [Neolecta irregularis DAH-3]